MAVCLKPSTLAVSSAAYFCIFLPALVLTAENARGAHRNGSSALWEIILCRFNRTARKPLLKCAHDPATCRIKSLARILLLSLYVFIIWLRIYITYTCSYSDRASACKESHHSLTSDVCFMRRSYRDCSDRRTEEIL